MINRDRLQSKLEEIINSATHGIGAVIAIPAIIYLLFNAFKTGDFYRIISFSIYGISLFLILFLSSFYHGVKRFPLKRFLNKLDHAGIFIFIAGTYTPFLLVTLRDEYGFHLLFLIWGLAIMGVICEIFWFKSIKKYTVWICLIMGWLAISQLKVLFISLPFSAISLLILGGITFTIGVYFYKLDHVKYAHNIWHIFVLGGSCFHYFAMFYI